MARYVVFIQGAPRQGKSTAAASLGERGFHVLSLDERYVAFVNDKYVDLAFPALNRFIGPHFDCIAKPGQRNGWYPTILEDWTGWVVESVERIEAESLVCEGYLLTPQIVSKVSDRVAGRGGQVHVVTAQNFRYYDSASGREVTLEDLATHE